MSSELRPKLGAGEPDFLSPVTYADVWAIEETTGPERLLIGPSRDHIEVMLALAKRWNSECGVLYVLLVPRLGNREPGRYQSPYPVPIREVEAFCRRFKAFFQEDARHHLWISSVSGPGLQVYDRHQWIYAYGDIPSYINVLAERGFVEGTINLPPPHSHNYNDAFDSEEEKLMANWDWIQSPLQSSDDE